MIAEDLLSDAVGGGEDVVVVNDGAVAELPVAVQHHADPRPLVPVGRPATTNPERVIALDSVDLFLDLAVLGILDLVPADAALCESTSLNCLLLVVVTADNYSLGGACVFCRLGWFNRSGINRRRNGGLRLASGVDNASANSNSGSGLSNSSGNLSVTRLARLATRKGRVCSATKSGTGLKGRGASGVQSAAAPGVPGILTPGRSRILSGILAAPLLLLLSAPLLLLLLSTPPPLTSLTSPLLLSSLLLLPSLM